MKKKSAHKTRLRKAEAKRGTDERYLHDSGSSRPQTPLEKIASFFAHQAARPPVEKKQKVMQRRGT
jgi:hypothetical protein